MTRPTRSPVTTTSGGVYWPPDDLPRECWACATDPGRTGWLEAGPRYYQCAACGGLLTRLCAPRTL